MTSIAIVVGSTRPNRRGAMVADWVDGVVASHPGVRAGEVSVSVLDLVEFDLPLLDEPAPPRAGSYRHEHTRRWSSAVSAHDGYLLVAPEYNHSPSPALVNALDYLCEEWADKAVGFVSYGVNGGVRAVQQLRLTCSALGMADVPTQAALSVFTDFTIVEPSEPGTFSPSPHHEGILTRVFDEVLSWAAALRAVRSART